MRSEFVFTWTSNNGDSVEVVFVGFGKIVPEVMGSYIKGAVQKGLFADAVLVICPSSKLDECEKILGNSALAPQRELTRASAKTTLLLAGYGVNGEVVKIKSVGKSASQVEIKKSNFEEIIRCGIEAIFRNGRGLVKAPEGYGFSKLSGGGSTHFIRAEDVLDDVGVVDFLAFNALRIIPDPQRLEHIFIDSMAISGVAYSLREMLHRNFNISCDINSFHSYGELKTVPRQEENKSFCIISASSSMSLQKDWIVQTGCTNEDTVTLLSFDDVETQATVLHKFSRPKDWIGDLQDASGRKLIRVLGERFSPEYIKPKIVELKRLHTDPNLKAFQGSDSLLSKITKAQRQKSDKTRALHIDFEELSTNPRFERWLDRHFRVSIPASIQGIIHLDDADSQMFARKCEGYLLENLKLTLSAGVRVYNDDSDLSSLDKDRAILIVAGIVGRGTALLSLSRELRTHHFGAKIYLSGAHLDYSISAAQFLKNNLTMAVDKSSQFHVFETFVTGTALRESFKSESDLIRRSEIFKKVFPQRATQIAGTGCGIDRDALLPRLKAKDQFEPLVLRKDFVFWEPKYDAGPHHAPAVLLTIGSILQRAREDEKSLENSLFSRVLQQVVLHPNMFSRFNDGIIQASLLRQANTSELDYSHIEEFSKYICQLLIGQLQKRYKDQGEAILEFALALKIGRLRISISDHRNLHAEAKKILNSADGYVESLLLELINPDTDIPANLTGTDF
jgi:hypothetical protein